MVGHAGMCGVLNSRFGSANTHECVDLGSKGDRSGADPQKSQEVFWKARCFDRIVT
jgi:hypothetical protein